MKFGKEFKTHLEETIPEWRDKFLCYKPLKKLLKNFPPNPSPAGAGGGDAFNIGDPGRQLPPQVADDHVQGPNRPSVFNLEEWFIRILNQELEKFNDFYVDKEEDFVIRLQELKGRIRSLKEKCSRDGVFTSESEFSKEMIEIRRDLVTIHGEMVLLKTYSSLNFAGLVKILKKYDKRTGGLLRLPFTQLALRQPFFTTEPLTRLVRECEANLELLFPLQAEVIESANDQDTSNPPRNAAEKLSPETSSDVGKETMHIYQSTLAAMKAIRGLQKASSTYNPLSFSFLFNGQADDNTSDVTAENSASNSPVTLQNKEVEEEEEEEDVSSD